MPGPDDPSLAGEVAPAPEAEQDLVNIRILKWVVIVLGVLLMAALVTVFGVIGYRLARPKPEPPAAEAAIGLVVRPGTEIGQIELDGNRMVVQLRHASGNEIVVIDVRSGKTLRRIRLEEGAPSASAD